MRILLWHVHGSWTTAFVQGRHEYLLPLVPDRGPDGRGRARTWEWPQSAIEVTREEARDARVDAVILQRPVELERSAIIGSRTDRVSLSEIGLAQAVVHVSRLRKCTHVQLKHC